MKTERQLEVLNRRIIHCRKCVRLVRYREKIARVKRRAYRDETYWGRPIPGFGDPQAELLVLGLAPAAHGANRTGRVFTGDRAGDFLFRALYEAGFANQPGSVSRDDGLKLKNCYVTAGVRCCPPGNKPSRREEKNCRPYLEEEFRRLRRVRAVLALGQIAHRTYLGILKAQGQIQSLAAYPFGHGAHFDLPALPAAGFPAASFGFASLDAARDRQDRGAAGLNREERNRTGRLFDSYHPSQQNTQTGRLTPAMIRRVLRDVGKYLDD